MSSLLLDSKTRSISFFRKWIHGLRAIGCGGQKHRDDAYVLYVDESKHKVEEIAFRIDANAISPELVRQICILASQLGCVLMTADYEILLPDESMVLATIRHSTAKKFVDDPVATLRKLGQPEMQKRFNNRMKDQKNSPPRRDG